ncbi:steroid Delta-isomerase [Paenibacillus pini]|uniref:Steroid delta-isomerase n=1 Tax=Paenibacillus pini JCM 16418 TaxID=1236976 RepID=W7YSY8_9BACL|nr:steroid Delta-isomerase [Paenibacillus pini]GAF07756.1 steroid delta-isomerase [Paenibacillus pini JCM 16418]
MPQEQVIKAAMQQYIDRFNMDNAEQLLSMFAENATVEDPVGKTPLSGKAAIEAFYRQVMNGNTRIKLDGPIRGSHGDSGAMCLSIETKTEEKHLLIHVIEVMTFNELGQIASMKAYWGPSDME